MNGSGAKGPPGRPAARRSGAEAASLATAAQLGPGVIIPPEYRGWWRIVSTSQWSAEVLDLHGPALLSINGASDRLRMISFLANLRWRPGKAGLVFAWSGAWQFEHVSGSGGAKLARSGRLHGRFEVAQGDRCTFIAERAPAPDEAIPVPMSYRDRWPRR
jgi:hypothetical protein